MLKLCNHMKINILCQTQLVHSIKTSFIPNYGKTLITQHSTGVSLNDKGLYWLEERDISINVFQQSKTGTNLVTPQIW
jgi:hypothetical protein